MYCSNCGASFPDGAKFCPTCGTAQAMNTSVPQQPDNRQQSYQQPVYQNPEYQRSDHQQQTYQQPVYQNPDYQRTDYQQPTYQQSVYQQPAYRPTEPAPQATDKYRGFSMKWYHFGVYFAFWFAALTCLSSCGTMISGSIYGNNTDIVYSMFGSLQILDIFVGLLYLANAVMLVITAVQMLKLKKNARKIMLFSYAFNLAISVIYTIAASMILADYLSVSDIMTPTVTSSILSSIVMLCVNNIYYKKRASLFVN